MLFQPVNCIFDCVIRISVEKLWCVSNLIFCVFKSARDGYENTNAISIGVGQNTKPGNASRAKLKDLVCTGKTVAVSL